MRKSILVAGTGGVLLLVLVGVWAIVVRGPAHVGDVVSVVVVRGDAPDGVVPTTLEAAEIAQVSPDLSAAIRRTSAEDPSEVVNLRRSEWEAVEQMLRQRAETHGSSRTYVEADEVVYQFMIQTL